MLDQQWLLLLEWIVEQILEFVEKMINHGWSKF